MSKLLLLIAFILLVHVSCNVDVSVNVNVGGSESHHPHAHAKQWLKSFLDSSKCMLTEADVDGAELDAAANIKVPFQSCGSRSDIASGVQIYSSQWPPRVGSTASITVKGTLKSDVTAGTWTMNAKLFLFSINRDGALPRDFLPAKAGPFSMSQSFEVPESPISGTPTVTVKLNDQRGKQITCIKFQIRV